MFPRHHVTECVQEAACRERLDSVLRELNDLLAEATRNMSDDRAPFFGGSRLNYTDCRLAPLLHHIKVPYMSGYHQLLLCVIRFRCRPRSVALSCLAHLVSRQSKWQTAG